MRNVSPRGDVEGSVRSHVVLLSLVIACDRSVAEPVAAPEPAPAIAAPVPGTPEPSEAPAAKTPDDASIFVTVAKGPESNNVGELRLFEIEGRAFAAIGPAITVLHSDGTIEHDRAWARGLEEGTVELDGVASGMEWWQTETLGGGWPDGTILALRPEFGSRGAAAPFEVYRRNNATWTRISTRERKFDWYPRQLGRWKDGSLLALKAFEPRYEHADPESGEAKPREVAAVARAIAKQKRLVVLRGSPKAPAFGSRAVQAFASLPTGEIVAAIAEGDRIVVLHHDDTDRELDLPGRGLATTSAIEMHARARDDVWILGEAPGDGVYLGHYDGTSWSQIPTACVYEPRSLSIDREGTAYFICGIEPSKGEERRVLFRVTAGAAEELKLPIEPWDAVALAPDDIWVAHFDVGTVPLLMHSGGEPREQTIPGTIAGAHAILEWSEPHALTDDCPTVWVPLLDGVDREGLAQKLGDLELESLYPSLVEARVRGEVKPGIYVRTTEGSVRRRIAELRTKLGKTTDTPTCNDYPPVTGDTHG
jgi:hypothetical protein